MKKKEEEIVKYEYCRKCKTQIPVGLGYYRHGKPFKCFSCGRVSWKGVK